MKYKRTGTSGRQYRSTIVGQKTKSTDTAPVGVRLRRLNTADCWLTALYNEYRHRYITLSLLMLTDLVLYFSDKSQQASRTNFWHRPAV